MNHKIIKILLLFTGLILFTTGCAAGYTNPPADLDPLSLSGIWKTKYAGYESDTIEIKNDKTFAQRFEDTSMNYAFEATGEWYLQYLPDGSVYIHLLNGRYYAEGIDFAERDGRDLPCPPDFSGCWWENEPFQFYDLYNDCFVEMLNRLILTVRVDYAGDIVFHHLWTSSDEGFVLIGGESAIFRRIEEP